MAFLSGKKESPQELSGSSSANVINTVIGPSVHIVGEVKSQEDLLLEGSVEGRIEGSQIVTVGRQGRVKGEVSGKVVRIVGKVEGDISALEKVEIVPEGKLFGNIKATRIVISEGALFKGKVEMESAVVTPPPPAPPTKLKEKKG